ncbi:phenylalanyl-tRNA synthetase beta chain [Elusimicrobium posterum]|uniref:phenylalanine--tRNA ligase subunit beta-related protein n=1 Tax=Elusimicrobium posterum TaxID=3116653 RepID=UPI003C7565FC
MADTRARVSFADNPRNTDLGAKFASSLIAQGFCECKNFDFVSAKDITNFGFEVKNGIEIANPLNEDWQYMRPTLFSGLLRNAAFNQKRSTRDYKLFETGKEYLLMKGFPAESWITAGIISGKTGAEGFKTKASHADFYYLKGLVESVLRDIPGVSFAVSKNVPSYMHPKICMDILLDGKQNAGFFGAVHPLTLQAYDIKTDDNVYAFYLNTKVLEKRFSAQDFKPALDVVQYPSSYRDLSFVIDKSVSYEAVQKAIASAGVFSKFDYKLIDLYEGANLGENKKSLTLSFAFWLTDRTLKDTEVEDIMNKIISALSATGAQLR